MTTTTHILEPLGQVLRHEVLLVHADDDRADYGRPRDHEHREAN